jgi:radical SAM protein with 4Fe4S-binding SPASM domain
MPLLAELYEEGLARELLLQPGNNIGYYGPFESLFRAAGDEGVHWRGCSAGLIGIGIEADGTIKGCPSLPTAAYAGGNVRHTPLEDIWRSAAQLRTTWEGAGTPIWGFCGTCYYSSVCRAGCTWTSHSLLGRPGNNPYCHHRVIELGRRGLRERVVQVERAPGASFDHGRFELVLESVDGNSRSDAPSAYVERLVPLRTRNRPASQIPALRLCRGCRRHIFEGTRVCPHCGGDVAALRAAHRTQLASARAALTALRLAMKRARRFWRRAHKVPS